MMRFIGAGIAIVCVCGVASGQTRLDAVVVTVSGRSVYINAGRNSGVTPGARVLFRLADGEQIEATIIDVSANSARAELRDAARLPVVNDRAEVQLEPPTESAVAPGAAPPHAPWPRQEGARSPDMPLLSPAYATRPQDRPTSVRGRLFTNWRTSKDLENDARYSYGRVGTWLDVQNPFGDGGRLLFEGDSDYRAFEAGARDDSDANARVQRFSYAWGLDQYAPLRAEVGRFYSTYLPELGVIDGTEGAVRFENGWSLGAGAGLYPTTGEDLPSGDDYGFHFFADYQSEDSDEWMQGTIGFQQTWHKGEPDRSVMIGRLNARPTERLSIFGSVLVDLYGANDTVEDQAAEVTQLFTQANYMLDKASGVNVSLTRISWPELKRDGYVDLPADLVLNGYVDRVSASVWRRLGDSWRVSARSHYWKDQDRHGFGGELSADWYSMDAHNTSAYASLYYEDSAFTKGVGYRLQAQRDIGPARVFAGYDAFAYSTDTLTGGSSDYMRHTLRADVSWSTGRWYWDIETTYDLGDSEESIGLGAYVQYRF